MTTKELLEDACFNLLDGKPRLVISRSKLADYLNIPNEAVSRAISAYTKIPKPHQRYRIQDIESRNEIEIQNGKD